VLLQQYQRNTYLKKKTKKFHKIGFKTKCDEKNVKEAVTEKVLVTYFVNKAKQQKSPTLWSR
jgi:hypothetical protein